MGFFEGNWRDIKGLGSGGANFGRGAGVGIAFMFLLALGYSLKLLAHALFGDGQSHRDLLVAEQVYVLYLLLLLAFLRLQTQTLNFFLLLFRAFVSPGYFDQLR